MSTPEAIEEAAWRLFATRPGASLADVAEEAGVGRVTIHRHFGTREALVAHLGRKALQAMDEAVDAAVAGAPTARAVLERAVRALVPLGDRMRFLAVELAAGADDPELAAHEARQAAEMAVLAERLKEDGDLPADVPTAWFLAALDHLVYAAWTTVSEGTVAAADAAGLVMRSLPLREAR